MRIWDTVLFRDELDLLECRLVQMENWSVYKHVLVESTVDHQGHPKPLVFAENAERFAPWKDRIVHVVADLPEHANPMDREAVQRDAIAGGMGDANPGDWVILADLDEIPNDRALAAVQGRRTGVLEMVCCIFAVDWLWGAPLRTSPIRAVDGISSFSSARREGWHGPVIPRAGHHLTWLGGQDGIDAKITSHCHTECNPDLEDGNRYDVFYREGHNPFGRFGYHGRLIPVDVDSTWPRWVYERRCPPGWFRPRARIPA